MSRNTTKQKSPGSKNIGSVSEEDKTMPDVGVLNLTIQDNSTQAASGLDKLANKLRSVRDAAEGYNLSNVQQQIANIVNSVVGSEKAVASLGTLFNAIANFSKAKIPKIDVSPIEKIKAAIGEGIKIGNAGSQLNQLRSALEGDWNAGNATVAGEALKTIAAGAQSFDGINLGTIAKNITNVAVAIERLQNTNGQAGSTVLDSMATISGMVTQGISPDEFKNIGINITAGITEGILSGKSEVVSAIVQTMQEAVNAAKAELEIHSPSQVFIRIGQFVAQGFAIGVSAMKVAGATIVAAMKVFASEAQAASIDVFSAIGGYVVSAFQSAVRYVTSFANTAGSLKGILQAAAGAAKSFAQGIVQSIKDVGGLKKAFEKMFPTLSGLLSRFQSVAKMRALRYIVKQISAGVSEGLKNLYYYSKEVGTDFAPAMDKAASALNQMKNSIGAALAPALQSLLPIIETVINAFITGVNYINQFFSLLSGQSTWTKAVLVDITAYEDKAADASADATAKAKKQAKEMKDLLADWDELNIIQSNASGGGGSGSGAGVKTSAEKTETSYSDMFAKVGEYSETIKMLVDGINEKFGGIWNLAKRIGIAVLGWKVASAFSGTIATLGAIVAGAGLIALEFDISAMLNGNYLKTGDEGWLVADVLQTLIGGVLMQKILSKVLAGQYAFLGMPIMLTVSALAGITTVIGSVDSDALSEESLKATIINALKLGGAAGLLMYGVTKKLTGAGSVGKSLAGGAAATLIAFGVVTGIQASVQAIRNGGVSVDTIKAAALGSIALSAGLGILAKLIVPTMGAGQAALFGVAWGTTAALVTVGATVGISAVVNAVKGDVTLETLRDAAISSVALGAGVGMAAKLLGASNFLAIGGFTALGVLAVIGVSVGIAAIIKSIPESIHWGDYEATEEEIKGFVENRLFKLPVDTIVQILDPQLELVSSNEEALKATLAEAKVTIKKLQLGYSNDDLIEELEKEVFGPEKDGNGGLLGQFKETAKSKQTLIETGLLLVPTTNDDGQVASIIDETSEAWISLTDHADSLGSKIAEHIGNAYDAELGSQTRAMELETVSKLTVMLANISAAMVEGQAWSSASRNLSEKLATLSKGSWTDLSSYITEYKETVLSEYTRAYDETTDEYAGLMYGLQVAMNNALELANGNEQDAEYLAKKEEYERIKAIYDSRVEGRKDALDYVESQMMNDETVELIRKAMLENVLKDFVIGDASTLKAIGELAEKSKLNPIDAYIDALVNRGDASGKTEAVNAMKEVLDSILQDAFDEEEYGIIRNLIDTGILNYSDLFADEHMVEVLKNRLNWNIVGPFGNGEETSALKDFVDEVINGEDEQISRLSAAQQNAKQQMQQLFGQSNVDLLNRPLVTLDDGSIATVLSETYTASRDGQEGIQWNEDIVMNFTPILPDGTRLTNQELDNYVSELLGRSGNIDELFWNDREENGGKGLLISADVDFTSFDEGIAKAEELMQKLHELQEEYYGLSMTNRASATPNGMPVPARLVGGGMTTSDVGWAPYNPNRGTKTDVEVVSQETDEQKRANISQGTSSLLEALNSILRVAEAINRKEFVVNVNPSTGLAQTVEKSDYRLERVRG